MTILKEGDTITKARIGLNDKPVKYSGCVITIWGDIITCDIPNTRGGGTIEKFNARTGVSIDGPDFGWLDEIVGDGWESLFDTPKAVTNDNP